MKDFVLVAVNCLHDRKTWGFESMYDMIKRAKALLKDDEIDYIMIDFTKIETVNDLEMFLNGIRYLQNLVFNII